MPVSKEIQKALDIQHKWDKRGVLAGRIAKRMKGPFAELEIKAAKGHKKNLKESEPFRRRAKYPSPRRRK